jgi:hypothetical protein
VDASAGVSDAYDRDQVPGSTTRTDASSEQAMMALVQAAATFSARLRPLVPWLVVVLVIAVAGMMLAWPQ